MYPVDEAANDPEFFAIRARLIVAIQKRDTAFLYSVVSNRIRNNFGGNGGGIAEFKKMWRPEAPDSKLWDTLGELLAFGGTFDASENFFAPYWYPFHPGGRADSHFDHGVVIGRGLKVRRTPTAGFAKRNGRWVLELLVAGD